MEVQKGILIMTSSQLYYLLLFSLGIEFVCVNFRQTVVVVVVESAGNCAKILSDCLQILRRIYSFFRNEMKGLFYQILIPLRNGPNLHVISFFFHFMQLYLFL